MSKGESDLVCGKDLPHLSADAFYLHFVVGMSLGDLASGLGRDARGPCPGVQNEQLELGAIESRGENQVMAHAVDMRVILHLRSDIAVMGAIGGSFRRSAGVVGFRVVRIQSGRNSDRFSRPGRQRPQQHFAHRIVQRHQKPRKHVHAD